MPIWGTHFCIEMLMRLSRAVDCEQYEGRDVHDPRRGENRLIGVGQHGGVPHSAAVLGEHRVVVGELAPVVGHALSVLQRHDLI